MAGDGGDALLCPRERKAELEARNGVVQIDYLTELITKYGITELRESHVLELQRIAVDEIYPCGGKYRDARSNVYISDSPHKPPEAALVPGYVRELIDRVNERASWPAMDRAAYALWRLNWIHPFRGGNGRTSRCIAYLILCMDIGAMIPGVPTLPSLIYDRRDDYLIALRAVDQSLREAPEGAEPNLSAMTTYVRDLVLRQMASAVDHMSSLDRR